MEVKAKKALGQHFLKDQEIAMRIVDALQSDASQEKTNVLEVGPGMGVLTQYLIKREDIALKVAEIDEESVQYLKMNFSSLGKNLIAGDFLKMDLTQMFDDHDFCVIGNFPYNISSQIFFKILDYREHVPQVVGMIQKEEIGRASCRERV